MARACARFVATGRNLDRWIDFKSYQVFEAATNYTALQFFTKMPSDNILVAAAPTGEIPEQPWTDPGQALPYGRQAFGDRWLLLAGDERARLIGCTGAARHWMSPSTPQISSSVYRQVPTQYLSSEAARAGPIPLHTERRRRATALRGSIEDELMKPLVSGPEAKRYVEPQTETYLLFPYVLSGSGATLIDPKRCSGIIRGRGAIYNRITTSSAFAKSVRDADESDRAVQR